MITYYSILNRKTIPKFFVLLLLLLITNASSIIVTYLTGIYVDMLNTRVNIDDIRKYAETLITLGITGVLVNFIYKYTAGIFQYNLSFKIQSRVISHVQHVPQMDIERYEPNYLSKRIIDDASTTTAYVIENSGQILVHAVKFVASSILLLKMNPVYFQVVLLFTPLYYFLYWIVKRPLYSASKQFSEETATYFERCVRQVSLSKRIKLNNLFIRAKLMLVGHFKHYLSVALRFAVITNLFNSIDVICEQVLRCLVIVIGGMLVIDDRITIGHFIVSMTYFGFVIQSVKYYLSLAKSYQIYKVAKDRLNELMDIPEEKNGDGIISQVNKINVSDISFQYAPNSQRVLDNFSYVFNIGSTYCIKGGNGTGKSTLLHILAGILPKDNGQITYNSTLISELNLYQMLENNVGYCFQNERLPNIELREWLEFLGIDEQAVHSESFLNTVVNCNGFSIEKALNKNIGHLSGGERQRVLLYCVLLKKPRIILLDEPTVGLDLESVKRLSEYLISIKKESIIICTTHDESFAEMFDEAIYLNSCCEE